MITQIAATMNPVPTFTSKFLFFALLLAMGMRPLPAQYSKDSEWLSETESQLKAIYERGEFRPRRFQGKWLPDSSGYIVQEKDPLTNRLKDVIYDVRTGQVAEKRIGEVQHADRERLLSPNGTKRLEFVQNNLFVSDALEGSRIPLTNYSTERDVRSHDPMWSPDGSHIIFIESDSTEVRQRPILDATDPSYPAVSYHRFARVGEKLPRLRVGLVDADGKNMRWLAIESPEEGYYLGQVEWAGNSQEVLVERLSRFRNKREFLLINIDGTVKPIYQETNKAWAVSSQGKNLGLTWIRDGKEFIVVSEMDGWRHAFLWSREGKKLSLLTPGTYDIIDRAAVDEDAGWYYFYASPQNATQRYLYRVPLDGSGHMERVTPENEPGTHHYDFSPNIKWAFHTKSRMDSPPVVELIELPSHRVVKVLEDNHALQTRLNDHPSLPTEFLRLDIDGGISMDAWMIKPSGFDETKKYPVFVYVYGEPHAQTVLDEWGAAQIDFHRVVASLGYLVVSIDNRGTPAPKGAAWRRAIFGSLGPLSTEEQEAGLKELARTRPYVDLSRVGIWGWSGGGSNTLNALFRKPDSYHVGIAVVPKPQPHLYNAWFQEIYMQTRELNPEGYKQAAAIHFAEGLQGNLLIVTGSGETNTHIQIIEGLIDRLIELGKPFDYMVYPNRDHGLQEGNGTLVHVRMLIIRYLLDHLPAGAR